MSGSLVTMNTLNGTNSIRTRINALSANLLGIDCSGASIESSVGGSWTVFNDEDFLSLCLLSILID